MAQEDIFWYSADGWGAHRQLLWGHKAMGGHAGQRGRYHHLNCGFALHHFAAESRKSPAANPRNDCNFVGMWNGSREKSLVPRHAELAWIFTCITSMARISQLPQYKEKCVGRKEPEMGLMMYPVLQAADILLYKSTHVPVGEDQLPQLQMAQQLVKTFNHRFGVTFPTPHSIISDEGSARLRSLRDPLKKMSKSEPDIKSRILLTDSPEEITLKIKKAVTDFTPEISFNHESRPGISNLIQIHCLLTDKIPEEICEEVKGVNTVGYKALVSDLLCKHLGSIRTKIQENLSRPKYLRDILQYGATKARPQADATYHEVYEKLGVGLKPKLEEKLHLLNI